MRDRVSHLVLGAVVVTTPFGLWTSDALGQTYSITAFATTGSVGTLVASTSTVTETLAPSGSFSPSGYVMHSPSLTYKVTVRCIDGTPAASHRCSTNNMVMVIKDSGAASGRLSSLVNFTIGNNSQTIVSGASGNPATLTLAALGNSATGTFNVGFGIPILTSGATGASTTRTFTVAVGLSATGLTSTSTGLLAAVVWNPIAVGVTSSLNFGKIISPTSGTATYTLTPGGSLTASSGGAIIASSTHSAAGFNITGEGAQLFQLTVPSSFTMTGGTTLTVTTTTSFGGTGTMTTQSFLGSLGTLGSFPFQVGGLLPVTAGTPSGAYTGSLIVNVNYN
jgi:hypothetical protein